MGPEYVSLSIQYTYTDTYRYQDTYIFLSIFTDLRQFIVSWSYVWLKIFILNFFLILNIFWHIKKIKKIYFSSTTKFSNFFDKDYASKNWDRLMLTRSAIFTRYARSREDSLREPNHIDNNPWFVVKHQIPISVVPKLFRDPIGIVPEIYAIAWDPTRTYRY